MIAPMPRLLFIIALLGAPIGAQEPPRETVNAWLEARQGPPGPGRLAATEALTSFAHASNLPRILTALEGNGRAVVATEAELEKLENARPRLARAHAAADKSGNRAKAAQATLELERLDADMMFRRRQLRDVFIECRALRIGYTKSLNAFPPEERRAPMQSLLRRAGDRAAPYPIRRQLMKLLAVIPNEASRAVLEAILTDDRLPHVRTAAADALGDHGAIESESALTAGLGDKYAVVRAACIASLRVVGGKRAVEALIGRISVEKGRLLQDCILALRHLTGVTFHDNAVLWQQWWERESKHYKRPGKGGKRVDRRLRKREQFADGNGPGFYGLRFTSHALVYLIDVSGSMNERVRGAGTTGAGSPDETKLTRAKRELVRALKALPSGIMVNVIAYSDGLSLYSDEMVKLDAKNRRGLVAWAGALRAEGKTNIYDALASVLDHAKGRRGRASPEMTVDTMVLLTDGLPTAGRVQDSELIASEVERLNDRTRIVLHTIGLGPDHDAVLLKRLSAESHGVYIRAR